MLPDGIATRSAASGRSAILWLPPFANDITPTLQTAGVSFVRDGRQMLQPGVSRLLSQDSDPALITAASPPDSDGDVTFVSTSDSVFALPSNVMPQWIDLIASTSSGYAQAPQNDIRFVAILWGYVWGTGPAGSQPASWGGLGGGVSLVAEARTRVRWVDLVGGSAWLGAQYDALALTVLTEAGRPIPGAPYTFSLTLGIT